jgi:hypothetical protein
MKTESDLLIINAECWGCHKGMLISLLGNETGYDGGPPNFTEKQQKQVKEKGVLLEYIFSKTSEESYLANVCGECGVFTGDSFLFAHYFAPAMSGEYKYEMIEGASLEIA